MERSSLLARAGLVTMCALFAGGLLQLSRASLSRSHPAFSSLRSNGEGTKLLWDGLARTGKFTQKRSYQPLAETHLTGCAVFYLGLRPGALAFADESFFRAAEQVAGEGNRLILGLTDDPIASDAREGKEPFAEKRWNVWFTHQNVAGNKRMPVVVEAHFPWQPLAVEGLHEGFERTFGAGSIVLLPRVSRLANAAIIKDEASRQLVPALIGDYRTVVFDEAHLGIVESGSIAGLARRYQLQGVLAGLLTLAALFLWNRSVAFPPVEEEREENEIQLVAENDARSTLAGLFTRHIRSEDLLAICVAEWNRVRPDQKITANQGASGGDPVVLYRNMQENLMRKEKRKI